MRVVGHARLVDHLDRAAERPVAGLHHQRVLVGGDDVVGVADEEWGQRIVAVYSSATPLDEAALLEACRERLPGYKKPKEFRRVRAFPLSSTGKIAKNVLRRRLEAGEEPGETA